MNVDIGITDKNRMTVVTLLKTILADAAVVYVKTLNYHWNVAGPHFAQLHEFFEEQYTELRDSIDEIAERIRQLGPLVDGSMARFLKDSSLKEAASGARSSEQMLKDLLSDHESVIKALRKAVDVSAESGDTGTSDFLTGLMEKHEKTAWMIRAHLQ